MVSRTCRSCRQSFSYLAVKSHCSKKATTGAFFERAENTGTDVREVVLETPRLMLRRWNAGDALAVASIYAKPEVMRFIPGGVWSRERTAEIIERMASLERQRGFGFYPILLKSDGRILGHCGLGSLEQGAEIELAYVLDSTHWQRGYATEAASAMIRHGFRLGVAPRIVAVAFPENLKSIAVMQRIGMSRVGRARHFGAMLEKYEIENSARSEPG